MIILSPQVVHRTTGKLCDEQSWRSRGWCRLERLAFCLSRFSVMEPPRAYVVDAPSGYSRLANITIGSSKHSVFNGEFTYEADRERLVPVVRKVVQCACAAREKQEDLSSWRKLVALKNSFFSGSDEWESVAAAPPSVSAYLSKFAFTSVSERGTHQMTCLHYAAFENNAAAVRMLIEAGAEVDARDTEAFPSGGGCTPLWFAVLHGCIEAAEALLQLRADVNCSASASVPAPLLLVGGYAPVAEAERCLALMLGYGLDVHSTQCWDINEGQYESSVARLHGSTLLGAAVYGGTAALVKMLLEAHADPLCLQEVAGGGRRTALDIARDEGRPDILALLVPQVPT
ncbi:hypothetical protein AB1Y20_004113 [Prymnesium parvum]|uniref:Uncharacterized protein n=1 Tax=Prymnesium parvum TaxID=97485 RepID=A0AB34J5T2_PRYPA